MKKRFLSWVISFFFACCIINTFSIKRANAENVLPVLASGRAECVMEKSSRRILYETRGDVRMPMASTTKIATAITILENCANLKEKVEIPKEAEGVEGSSVYLKKGEIYTIEDLLYGLMLRSGNDCATALALVCGGSIEGFATKMNQTAQKAGALATKFANPHGLPCIGHYTTAHDLSLITCYAMRNPTFCKIVSTKYYDSHNWKNKNKLLFNYENAIGVKTGYTKEAGRCLVSAAKKGEMILICSVLNCPDMYERSQELLEDAFSVYEYVKLIDENEIFDVGENKYRGKTRENIYYPLLSEEKDLLSVKTVEINDKRKDENGEIIGQIQIFIAKRLLFSKNLYKL